jgi:Fe-S cluster assembly protein SufB
MSDEQNSVSDILEDSTYKYGFTTDVESDTFAKGLDEDVVRA